MKGGKKEEKEKRRTRMEENHPDLSLKGPQVVVVIS